MSPAAVFMCLPSWKGARHRASESASVETLSLTVFVKQGESIRENQRWLFPGLFCTLLVRSSPKS